jgi:hypothetical protein
MRSGMPPAQAGAASASAAAKGFFTAAGAGCRPAMRSAAPLRVARLQMERRMSTETRLFWLPPAPASASAAAGLLLLLAPVLLRSREGALLGLGGDAGFLGGLTGPGLAAAAGSEACGLMGLPVLVLPGEPSCAGTGNASAAAMLFSVALVRHSIKSQSGQPLG